MTDQPYAELIAKLEAATGPSRDLNARIWWATNRQAAERMYWKAATGRPRPLSAFPSEGLGHLAMTQNAPGFTGSFDAALTLVPPDHDWIVASVNGHVGGTPYACVGSTREHHAETPVLALCIAALKARQGDAT